MRYHDTITAVPMCEFIFSIMHFKNKVNFTQNYCLLLCMKMSTRQWHIFPGSFRHCRLEWLMTKIELHSSCRNQLMRTFQYNAPCVLLHSIFRSNNYFSTSCKRRFFIALGYNVIKWFIFQQYRFFILKVKYIYYLT